MIHQSLAVLAAVLLPLAAMAAPALPPLPRVTLANGDPAMTETLTGRWTVTEVAGATIPPGAPVWLEFGEGSVVGKSGCNSFSASATVSGGNLTVGPARATKMACDTALMAVESAFHGALGRVTRFEIAPDGTLLLSGADALLMRAVRE